MQTEQAQRSYHLITEHKRMLADTITPVNIYLKIRDRYNNPILLESSDYHSSDNSFSFICCDPIATFSVKNKVVKQKFPDGSHDETKVAQKKDVIGMLSRFAAAFHSEEMDYKFVTNGLFGYMGYDAVQYYEDIDIAPDTEKDYGIPEIHYAVYRYVIAIDHFRNELYAFNHELSGEASSKSKLDDLISLINNRNIPNYRFQRQGEESSNYTDDEFMEIISKGRDHCFRGDVFQIVLSRRFQNHFKGDEFNVYRALRSINPSPYLFYFDYGSHKIFGSSPEAQIVIKGGEASIFPIAGTFKRTGNDAADAELAKKLLDDPKENSEHVMLVDLARNDLSRHGSNVAVETFKEVQYFSHVIHLVSKVTSSLSTETSPIQVVADTFPAGTLSGAPKHMAMQLINQYESSKRGYYGGAIGFMGFGNEHKSAQFNHAIMIRSFLSQNNTLYFQAGAGVVAKSEIENELQEVNNKLAALRRALDVAENITN
jgi:anthranilate synthase component 1